MTVVCKTCNIEKDIDCFYFNKTHQAYRLSCKECVNTKRNKTYKEKRGTDFYYPYSNERKKKCQNCNILKELNDSNFYINLSGYSKLCLKCIEAIKMKKKKTWEEGREVREKASKSRRVPAHVLSAYKSFDLKKGLETDLPKWFIIDGLSKPCIYCGFPSTGFDRIDNKKGHTMENCNPCCKECNVSRNNNFSCEEMKIIGKVIHQIKTDRINNQ